MGERMAEGGGMTAKSCSGCFGSALRGGRSSHNILQFHWSVATTRPSRSARQMQHQAASWPHPRISYQNLVQWFAKMQHFLTLD